MKIEKKFSNILISLNHLINKKLVMNYKQEDFWSNNPCGVDGD